MSGDLGVFSPQGPFETRLFINGEFVDAKTGKTFPTVNPVTEEIITKVQEAGTDDVDIAVAAARAAFEGEWSEVSPSGRRDFMLKLADLIEKNKDYLISLESLDNGKSTANAKYSAVVDLTLVISVIRYYAGWSEKINGKVCPIDGPFFSMTRHEPVGVVGQIIPWNFPLLMMAWKLGPALATGCTVVMK
eukprot:403514_1